MRALQNFRESPFFFGDWFLRELKRRPLPWAWDAEEADLLLGWAWKFGWLKSLQDQDPPRQKAAAALGTMLAQAHRDCFREDGDHAVWKRLGPRLGIHEVYLGTGATRLSQVVGVHRKLTSETDLKHLIPFVQLVGCPPQALPILGQKLKGRAPLPQRFKALFESQWESMELREAIQAWLRGGGPQPSGLEEPEAQLLKAGRTKERETKEAFRWRCLLVGKDYRLVLVPVGKLDGLLFQGRDGGPLSADDATRYGLLQILGQDGLVTVDGKAVEIAWHHAEPTLWSAVPCSAPGVIKTYERTAGQTGDLCCLPPGWSLDGESEPSWRWVPVAGKVSFFDPDGTPWVLKEDGAPLEVHDSVSIVGRTGLPVIHRLPLALQELVVTTGDLGSTLDAGQEWTPESETIPPQGHLILRWRSSKGTRRKEVFCMPALQLTRQEGAKLRIWVRGMEGLIGREAGKWFELPVEMAGNRWTTKIALRNWAPNRPDISLQCEGIANTWCGLLRGNTGPFKEQLSSPWAVDLSFFERVYLNRARIEVKLPEGVEAKLWTEDGGEVFSQKTFQDKSLLAPLEQKELLAPALEALPATARPIRVGLAWPTTDDQTYQSLNLFRIFPRASEVGVSVHGGCLEVGGRDIERPFNPSEWTVRVGSTHSPRQVHEWPLSTLKGIETAPGQWQFRAPDLPAKWSPYFVQLLRSQGTSRPLSIHTDHAFSGGMLAVDAFFKAMQKKGIGGVDLPGGDGDHRDRILHFVYDFAGTHDPEGFISEDVQSWLGHLEHDFLFSQPWTLGIALRHPDQALLRLADLHHDPESLSEALARLGQSGWSWWLVPYPMAKQLNASTGGRLEEALINRAKTAMSALKQVQNPGAKLTLIHRFCEEGFHRFLPKEQRFEMLKAMEFPIDWMRTSRSWSDMGGCLLRGEVKGLPSQVIGNLIMGPFKPRPLPKLPKVKVSIGAQAPILESIERLAPWAAAYSKWSHAASRSLLCADPWPDVVPDIFRHYAVPLTLFTSSNLVD